MNEKQLEVVNEKVTFIESLESANNLFFCTMSVEDEKGKYNLYKVMNNPDYRTSDCINQKIKIRDVYCEAVDCVSEQTGEVTTCPRVVLIDMNGKSYVSVSFGIYNSLRKLFAIFGAPTWENGVEVTVKQKTNKDHKILILDV